MRCGSRTRDSTTQGQAPGVGPMWRRERGFTYTVVVMDAYARVRGRGRAGGWRSRCTQSSQSMPPNRPFISAIGAVKGSSITAQGRAVSLATLHQVPRAERHRGVGGQQRGRRLRGRPSGQGRGRAWPRSGSDWTRRKHPSFSVTAVKAGTSAARGAPARRRSSRPCKWMHWYNHRCLFGPIEHVPLAACKAHNSHQLRKSAMAAWLKKITLRDALGRFRGMLPAPLVTVEMDCNGHS